MSKTDYKSLINKLYTLGNYEQSARSRDLSKLQGIHFLLKELNLTKFSFKIIHIAGTNGKGLTGLMLSHILTKSGYATGWYNSPHLVDIRERVIINKQKISHNFFSKHLKKTLEISEQHISNHFLSFFDILTATALSAFEDSNLDWVILETGLGGRSDSTNVTNKEASVITNISYDHINILGSTLQEIAHEKLGIVRKNTPTILAEQNSEIHDWILKELKGLFSPANTIENLKIITNHNDAKFYWGDGLSYQLPLCESNQSTPWWNCINTTLRTLQQLFPSDIHKRKEWTKELFKITMPGRLEYKTNVPVSWGDQPFSTVIIDGGHNKDAFNALNKQLHQWNSKPYILVFGIAADKLIPQIKDSILELFQNASQVLLVSVQQPRSATQQQIKEFIKNNEATNHLHILSCKTISEAITTAYESNNTPLVISGSFYLVGEAMKILSSNSSSEAQD